jgi:hypothetical protein
LKKPKISLIYCNIKSEIAHFNIVISILGKIFFEILKLTKSLKKKRILEEGLQENFYKKIAHSNLTSENVKLNNSEIFQKIKSSIDSHPQKIGECEKENIKEKEDYFDDNDLTTKEKGVQQMLVQKFSKNVTEAFNINKKLIDIHETIQTFSSHVFDQEQKTSESIFKSIKKCIDVTQEY